MHKKRIILANAAIRSGNKGCTALSYTALYFIDKVLSECNVDYEIFLTDSGYPPQGSYSITIGKKKIKYQTVGHPLGIGIKGNIRKVLFFPKTIKALYFFKKADYILDIGQGDSFSDIYGEDRFYEIDRIHFLSRLLKVPYCLLPQTIGPFDTPSIASKARQSIAKAKTVMARDKMSFDYVRDNVPEQKHVEEFIDVAFYLPFEHRAFDKHCTHVGLNINALLWNGGYTGRNELGLRDDYKSIIRSIIDYFLQVDGVKLHLIPHVIGQERGLENDYSVSVDLVNEYNNPKLVMAPFFFSPIEAKSFISGMDFFMGARMHSTIAAFSSGVPVVPMAYSRKFNGLFGDTLSYKYYLDLKTADSKEIIDMIRECYNNREVLSQAIQSQNNLIKEREIRIEKSLKGFFSV